MHSPLIEPLETRIAPASIVGISGPGTVSEGSSGNDQTLIFTVTLSEAATSDVVVDVVPLDGSAVGGSDYEFAGQAVTIPAGQLSTDVQVVVKGDSSFELDETFSLRIQNLTAGDATIGTSDTATTTILNDDIAPTLNVLETAQPEGNATGTFNFTLVLSEAAGVDVTVRVTTSDGSATSGDDYVSADQIFTIPAGSAQATFGVTLNGDTTSEGNETFTLNLSEASNASLGTVQAIGTILDDDALVISADDLSVAEGNGKAIFTVRLSQAQAQAVTVGYFTQDGSALAPGDYISVANATVTFQPGETTKEVEITLVDDQIFEPQENFRLRLQDPSAGTIPDDEALATITDDDTIPVLTISGPGNQAGTVTLDEGDNQRGNIFTLRLDHASGAPITVHLSSAGGTATSGVDFTAINRDITFAAGETVKTVTLTVLGDTTDELDETLTLTATSMSGGVTLPAAPTTVRLRNDDVRINVSDVQVTEGDAETVTMNFTLTLSAASTHAISLNYATADGTAGSADYTALANTPLTFAAGETEKTISVTIAGDLLGEADEFFTLNFSNVQNALISQASVRGTIADNDPFLSIGDMQVVEGGTGTTKTMVFTVSLLRVSGAVTVDYATGNIGTNSATAGPSGDYVAANGTLSFAEGETTKTISVTINGDATDESDETFGVTLSNPSNAALPATTVATGTIIDDEGLLTVSNATLIEGDSGTANMVFVVNLLNRLGTSTVTVNYATSDGTAISTGDFADFTATSGTLTFNAGENQKSILVPVRGDLIREGDQSFTLALSGAVAASIGTPTATGTITDNDPVPAFTVTGGTVAEGDDGSAVLLFTVSLAGSAEVTTSVDFATQDGTALAGSDYTTVTATTLTFAPGQTSTTISVPLLGDAVVEGSETVLGVLSNVQGATIATASAAGTIVDDDIVVTLSGGDFASPVAEGNAGGAVRKMTVTLSQAPLAGNTVTVHFSATPGTASAGTDYALATVSPLVFNAGETSKTIDINVLGDTVNEANETVDVALTSVTGGKLGATIAAVATIADDDTVISVSGGAVAEGNAGTADLVFTISLNGASSGTVSVNFTTQNGSATAGEDYTLTMQSLTFAPGETSKTVTVPVLGDVSPELSETVLGVLMNVQGATIGASTPGTIRNDEILVNLAGFAGPVAEGNAGTSAQSMTVTLTSAPLAGSTVEVNFVVTAGTATPGADFTVVTSSPLVFSAGETSKTIDFTILGDTRDEADETFTVTLVSASNASIDTAGATGTIADDDASPTVSIGDATITEGNSGTSTLAFTVTLSTITDQTVTVKASTALLAGDLAVAPGDFAALNDVLITFAPGQTTKEVAVSIVGDIVDEPAETFHVQLSDAQNATLLDGEALGTILDNDMRSLSIADAAVIEGDSGTTTLVFTVSISTASAQTVTVNYQTANGTATAGAAADFLSASGTVTFAPGDTSKTVEVTINGDLDVEPDETLLVQLSNATNATIADAEAMGTIRTDETKYTIANAADTEEETSSTGKKLIFVVTRTGDLSQAGSVSYTTVDGTAVSSGVRPDFDAKSGTATFAAGVATANIEVQLKPDTHHETNETFTLRLSGATGGVLADGMGAAQATLDATGTITNNDNRPTFSINDATVNEGTTNDTNKATFTVKLSAINEVETMTVDFLTMAGTARDEVSGVFAKDFNAIGVTTLTFATGQTTTTLQVTAIGDTVDEDNETFTVVLQNAKAGTEDAIIADATGLGTIIDDDIAPLVVFANGDQTVSEGTIGNSTLKPKIELRVGANGALAYSEKPITVKVTTTPGTATAGVDYIAEDGDVFTLTIPAGENTAELEYTIVGDAIREVDETFSFALSEPTNVRLGDGGVKITIQNDDPVPQLAISDVTVIEGDSGSSDMVFTVALQGATDKAVTVSYATTDGTAVSKGGLIDFIAASGALSFAPGETTKTIAVKVNGDTWAEADETFKLKLSGASNATILTAEATGTILNGSDTVVGLVVQDAVSVENPFTVSGTTTTPVSNPKLTFKVELTKAVDAAVTFTAQTRNGTAIATGNSDSDYTALSQSFSIAAGNTSVDVAVSIQGDTAFESTEHFYLGVGSISSGVLEARGEGRGVLLNDDLQVVDSRTLRYIDEDGDLATLKITKGAITAATLTFGPVNVATGGRTLQLLDFTSNPALFNGTDVRISVEPQIGFASSGLTTDGKVDVGFIRGAIPDSNTLQFTRGIDFGSIVVPGDVAKITAGDLFTTPSIAGKISVQSLGVRETETGAPDNISAFLSTVNAISVSGDVMGIVQVIGSHLGSINSLKIEGALRGDTTNANRQSGIIFFTGTLGKATIGEIIGGAATDSGVINGNTSYTAKIGSIKVLGDIVGGTGTRSGRIVAKNIGSVIVEGDVIGGGGTGTDADGVTPKGSDSGEILATRSFGNLRIDGDVIGGVQRNTGIISSGGTIGTLRIGGSLIGGSGSFDSGVVIVNQVLSNLVISGDVLGGAGERSGSVQVGGTLTKFTIGASGATTGGNVKGGAGDDSGTISAGAGINQSTGDFVVSGGAMGNGLLYGDLMGGGGNGSGGVQVGGTLTKLDIRGDLIGGDSPAAGVDTVAKETVQTGFVLAGRLTQMTLTGDLRAGNDLGAGLADSGSIRVHENIGTLTILGNVAGNESVRAVISAGNNAPAVNGVAGPAISKLTIGKLANGVVTGGMASFLNVLAGYAEFGTTSDPLGAARNADAKIGTVTIRGDMEATNIVAGAETGADGLFGTADDVALTGTGVTDKEGVVSSIAKVIVGGNVLANDNEHGIVAQLVSAISAANLTSGFSLSAKAGNDFTEIADGTNVLVNEVSV